jgi:hypothetical protein
VRKVERAVRGEPIDSRVARRVELDPAGVEKEHTVGARERSGRTLLGDEHGARQARNELEELVGCGRVELRRRLVEQEQSRPERECRREAHAL